MSKKDTLPSGDLEWGDIIWLKEVEEYQMVEKVHFNLSNNVGIEMENGKVYWRKINQKIELM